MPGKQIEMRAALSPALTSGKSAARAGNCLVFENVSMYGETRERISSAAAAVVAYAGARARCVGHEQDKRGRKRCFQDGVVTHGEGGALRVGGAKH